MQKIISWISIAILIIIVIFALTRKNDSTEINELTVDQTGSTEIIETENTEDSQFTVSYNGTDFSPLTTTISLGTTVTFTNESTSSMWVASDSHPSHTLYPGSSIANCGKQLETPIFDQCQNGENFTFTFNEICTWKFHNHLNPKAGGTIVVTN